MSDKPDRIGNEGNADDFTQMREQSFTSANPRQLHSSVFRRGLGFLGKFGKNFMREFRPRRKDMPAEALATSISRQLQGIDGVAKAQVSLGERFGAGTLIEFDLTLSASASDPVEVLTHATKVCWHNPWLAPVVIRPRVSLADRSWDATQVGFSSETAFAGELYNRFGAPKADPNWRP